MFDNYGYLQPYYGAAIRWPLSTANKLNPFLERCDHYITLDSGCLYFSFDKITPVIFIQIEVFKDTDTEDHDDWFYRHQSRDTAYTGDFYVYFNHCVIDCTRLPVVLKKIFHELSNPEPKGGPRFSVHDFQYNTLEAIVDKTRLEFDYDPINPRQVYLCLRQIIQKAHEFSFCQREIVTKTHKELSYNFYSNCKSTLIEPNWGDPNEKSWTTLRNIHHLKTVRDASINRLDGRSFREEVLRVDFSFAFVHGDSKYKSLKNTDDRSTVEKSTLTSTMISESENLLKLEYNGIEEAMSLSRCFECLRGVGIDFFPTKTDLISGLEKLEAFKKRTDEVLRRYIETKEFIKQLDSQKCKDDDTFDSLIRLINFLGKLRQLIKLTIETDGVLLILGGYKDRFDLYYC